MCASQDEKPWEFPQALRSQMEARLQQFTQAQAEGQWDEVARLLGDYRRGWSYIRYTPAHKECLIRTMKESPMVSFDYRIQESPFSSEIFTTPSNRRWWTLVGEGTFQTASGLSKREIAVVAYRDGEDWFFTPPPLDNVALSTAVTTQDLAADRKDAVEIRIPSDAPLEVVDLHVHIDAKDLSSRTVEFRFHNKSNKKVTAYSFVLDDEKHDGSISVGTGDKRDAILPQGDSRVWNESHNAFLYWCEGEAKIRITLEDVTFEDGMTWTAKKDTTN
jgi:hypothetical protein